MQAYKAYVRIENPAEVLLHDLPFKPGQVVEILVIAQDERMATEVDELRSLFKKTQNLPSVRALSIAEVDHEAKLLIRDRNAKDRNTVSDPEEFFSRFSIPVADLKVDRDDLNER